MLFQFWTKKPCKCALYWDVAMFPQSCCSCFFKCADISPVEEALGSLECGTKTRQWHSGGSFLHFSFFQPWFSLGREWCVSVSWRSDSWVLKPPSPWGLAICSLPVGIPQTPWGPGRDAMPALSSCPWFFILEMTSLSYRAVSRHVRKSFVCLISGLFLFTVRQTEQNVFLSILMYVTGMYQKQI